MGSLILFGAFFRCWAFLCSDPFPCPRWGKTLRHQVFSSWCFVLSERGTGRKALWSFKMPAVSFLWTPSPLCRLTRRSPCLANPLSSRAFSLSPEAVFLPQNGESWAEGPCRECECRDAAVTCFQRSCPPCPRGSRPLPGKGDCCPRCQPGTEPGHSLPCSGISAAFAPPAPACSPRGILSCLFFSVAN